MLKYSIEQLIHMCCGECGYTWTLHGQLPDFLIHCPRCNEYYYPEELEDLTAKELHYCPVHEIWFMTDKCPLDKED